MKQGLAGTISFITVASFAPLFGSDIMDNGVTGHRGNAAAFPENTIPSFASAIDLGVDWIELDAHLSKDGKLVVIHDFDTGRVGDRKLKVSEETFETLSSVDVASSFRKARGLPLELCPPQRIPLLEEVLKLAMEKRRARVSIQPKADCVKEALALIARLDAWSFVGFNDGDLSKMKAVKRANKDVPVFWDRGDSNPEKDLQIALKEGFECLVVHFKSLDKERVDRIHAAGLKAGVWTIDDEAGLRRFLSIGVDRIYTDDPALLLKIKGISR